MYEKGNFLLKYAKEDSRLYFHYFLNIIVNHSANTSFYMSIFVKNITLQNK